MIRPLVAWGLLVLATCASGSCESKEPIATRFPFEWGGWRAAGAFGVDDSIYWVRLREGEIEVAVINEGKPQYSSKAQSALVNGLVPGITSDRGDALYLVTTTLGGGLTQVFRYEIATRTLEEYWSGEILGAIITAHFLPESSTLIIVTQNFCYLLGDSGKVTDFGPATHAEVPWFFSASSASSRALALNLNDGLMVYQPGARAEKLEERDRATGVHDVASIGDQWLVLHSGPGERLLRRLGAQSAQAIPTPAGNDWRLRSYGEIAILWAIDSDDFLFVGPDDFEHIELNREGDFRWYLINGYSNHSVFLIDEDGYWTLPIPQSLLP